MRTTSPNWHPSRTKSLAVFARGQRPCPPDEKGGLAADTASIGVGHRFGETDSGSSRPPDDRAARLAGGNSQSTAHSEDSGVKLHAGPDLRPRATPPDR